MPKRFSVFGLMVAVLTFLMVPSMRAQSPVNAEGTARARAKVARIGTGQTARVDVKLRDESRIRGYISMVEPESFTVVERDSGAAKTLSYQDVAEIKRPGNGLSTKNWLIIGAAAAGAIVTWSIVKPAVCDGGAQSRGPC